MVISDLRMLCSVFFWLLSIILIAVIDTAVMSIAQAAIEKIGLYFFIVNRDYFVFSAKLSYLSVKIVTATIKKIVEA